MRRRIHREHGGSAPPLARSALLLFVCGCPSQYDASPEDETTEAGDESSPTEEATSSDATSSDATSSDTTESEVSTESDVDDATGDTGDDTEDTTESTEETSEDTGMSDFVEPCEGCWSGFCEIGIDRCALGVFTTATQFTGDDFLGVGWADDQCRAAAGVGAPPFKAWLSTDAETAPDHVNLLDARVYVLPDGTVVADQGTAFLNAGLLHAIDQGPDGLPLPEPPEGTACPNQGSWTVWTGTEADGAAGSANCGDWLGGNSAVVGRSDVTDGGWTDQCNSNCTPAAAAFYCFEDDF